MSTLHRQILMVSCLFAGSVHDYAMLKRIFNPHEPWFHDLTLLLDLGFLGARNDYGDKAGIQLPHKKPRKSKDNPNPQLTSQQKLENKKHAMARVVIEHAIGGMKHFHCLVHRIRNHLNPVKEYFFLLSAGLWNLKISL